MFRFPVYGTQRSCKSCQTRTPIRKVRLTSRWFGRDDRLFRNTSEDPLRAAVFAVFLLPFNGADPNAVEVFVTSFRRKKDRSRSRQDCSRSRQTSDSMARLPNSQEFGYEIPSRRWADPLFRSSIGLFVGKCSGRPSSVCEISDRRKRAFAV